MYEVNRKRISSVVFCALKGVLQIFLNEFPLTQLKDCIKYQHEKELKKSFKELPFYTASIEKPYIKPLKNIDMLRGLPLYNGLNIVKTSNPIKRYARCYNVKVIN